MIYTQFLYGQGWGNQLPVYVTTRAIAKRNGYEFGFAGLENLGDRRYNDKGVYFMDLHIGMPIHGITSEYTEIEKKLEIVVEKSDKAVQYTQDIKNDLKSDIRRLEKVVEQVERDGKQLNREVDQDMRQIRKEIDNKIQKALDNPLANK